MSLFFGIFYILYLLMCSNTISFTCEDGFMMVGGVNGVDRDSCGFCCVEIIGVNVVGCRSVSIEVVGVNGGGGGY